MKKYSVLIPVYNSQDTIQKVVEGVINEFIKNSLDYEVVLVNDGSADTSWTIIAELAKANKRIVSVNLLKNYGQHTAVFCGLKYASGDYIITMDDDLQNPPDQIVSLIGKIEEGHDAVFGKFMVKQHGVIRKMGSKIITLINRKIFNSPQDLVLSNFRIITRAVANRILDYKTNYPYITGLVLMFSHNMANVEVRHEKRASGKSKYSVVKILQVVSLILFNYSSYPLRLVSVIGLMISLLSFAMGAFFLIKTLMAGSHVSGWTSIVVLITFFNCMVSLMLGMIGEYIARLINQMALSSPYYIKDAINHEK